MKAVKYVLVYTFIFSILFFGCYGVYFMAADASLFEKIDGYEQHYTAFVYMGRWLSEIARNIFTEHNFILPMWNHGMGYGADIPTTLVAYVFDPLNYLAAVFPEQWSEWVFDVTIVLRFYLCGLAYSCFAFFRRQSWQYALIGSVLYTFCGSMYIGFIQMYFINPMYLFPLLIVGFDRLWQQRKIGMYTLILAMCFLNHFYFAYMMCVFLLGYGILHFIEEVWKTHRWQEMCVKMLIVVGCSLLAVGIASIMLLPLAENMLQQGRMGIDYFMPEFYSADYYKALLLSFIRPTWMWNRDCIVGFGALSLPCLFVFFKNKGNVRLKIEFILLTLCLCIPFLGYILNGFSYAANRWVWAYCLVTVYIVGLALQMMELKTLIMAIGFVLVYIASVCYWTTDIGTSILFLIVESATLSICFYACKTEEKQRWILYAFAMVFSVLVSAYTYFSPAESGFVRRSMKAFVAYDTLINDSGLPVLQRVMAGDVRRYNQIEVSDKSNAAWIYGLSGTNFYMSIYNNNIDRFHRAIALLTPPWVTQYYGLNRRAELAALLGVEYFIADDERVFPIGYDKRMFDDEYIVARPMFPTSLIYGFEQALSADDFEKLTPYERQQALLQTVVVEHPLQSTPLADLDIQNADVPYQYESNLVFDFKNKSIRATRNNLLLNLLTEPLSDGEIYVYFKGLDFKKNIQRYFIEIAGGHLNKDFPTIKAKLSNTTYHSHVYGNIHDWLINLGYTLDELKQVNLFFSHGGKYEIDDFKIYLRTRDDILRNISHLKPLGINVQMADNKFAFDVRLDKQQYVFMSIPYSRGWRSYVNGKEMPLLKTDLAFMSLLLPQGNFHVELHYETPYLRLGAWISLLSLLLLGLLTGIRGFYRGKFNKRQA